MDKPIKEFKIETLSQVDAVLAAIKANFAKEEAEQEAIIVRFDDKIAAEDLVTSLNKLWQCEIDSGHTIDILIKNLSYNCRKSALGAALKTKSLKNPVFLQNIFCLIKGYNTFDEAYFNHEQVFLNDEVEFLDIFDDLENEIAAITLKMAEYYISMLKTCNMIDGVENNPNIVKIEPLYEYLFGAVDVTILARILSSSCVNKNPSIWETKKIVMNSLGYLGMVAEKFVFTNTVLNLFGETFLKDTIEKAMSKKE